MQKADAVEVIDIVVDDADGKGRVEGEAINQLPKKLTVPSKSPVPDRQHGDEGEDDKILAATWYLGGVIDIKTMWKVARRSFVVLCKLLQTFSTRQQLSAAGPKQDPLW